jgi:DNA replication and repair protein RecF
MRISSIRYVSFRNLADAEINTDVGDVFLVGQNGQGKSNFLEALYYSIYASSFRSAWDRDIARKGETDFSVSIEFGDEAQSDTIQVKCQQGRKEVLINNKRAESRQELLYMIPCIIYCHEDMEFVSGSAERRRWFFDQNICLYDSSYLDDLQRFKKLLKTRNHLLKTCKENLKMSFDNEENYAMLDTVDVQMAEYAVHLIEKRRSEAKEFSSIFSRVYEEVAGIDNIEVRYAPSWRNLEHNADAASGYAEKLRVERDNDIQYGATMCGPHRDRYIFSREGLDFAINASTGQRRLLSLLLRCGQALRYYAMTGKRPVLLFDDVLLELDQEKRRKFLACMPEYDQAFYTFLPGEPYDLYKKPDTLIYQVEDGFKSNSSPLAGVVGRGVAETHAGD